MSLSPKLMKKLAKKGFTLEQIDYIDKEVYMEFKRQNSYKVLCGRKVKCIRKILDSLPKYFVMVALPDNQFHYIEIKFINCEEPPYDEFFIVINEFNETFTKLTKVYKNILNITDYDLVIDSKIERVDAIRKYISDLNKSNLNF